MAALLGKSASQVPSAEDSTTDTVYADAGVTSGYGGGGRGVGAGADVAGGGDAGGGVGGGGEGSSGRGGGGGSGGGPKGVDAGVDDGVFIGVDGACVGEALGADVVVADWETKGVGVAVIETAGVAAGGGWNTWHIA